MSSMSTDGQPSTFYRTRLGAVTARLLRGRIARAWPDLAGLSVLGIGHPAPYLRLWRDNAQSCVAALSPGLAPARWPGGLPSRTCLIDDEILPFSDLNFDRVLLIHSLETAGNAQRLLREVWRVLKDDGRIMVVVPNRSSLWAHSEITPFGHGRPYSAGQLDRLLGAAMFEVAWRDAALFIPPLRWRIVLRAAGAIERAGRNLLPRCGGVTLAEARKNMYQLIPSGSRPQQRKVLVGAA